jgi:hypothetical protein
MFDRFLQKRNRKGTIRLIIVPIYLCLLLTILQRVINSVLDKPKFRCGCKCVDVNGTGSCQNVCGIQYSTLDQAGSCPIPNPPEWPALLQLPRPEYRAMQESSLYAGFPDVSCRKSQSCAATIPFTGANETLSNIVMQNLFTSSPLSNLSDNASISSLLLGTDVPGTYTGFIEPAFVSDRPIYVLRPQCKASDSVTVPITFGDINIRKEMLCIQGLPLWRNSSAIINEETFNGYRKGKSQEGINEIPMGMQAFLTYAISLLLHHMLALKVQITLITSVITAYDFQDSNEKHFSVLALYNSTYQNVSYVPMPFGLLHISRSLNAVGLTS